MRSKRMIAVSALLGAVPGWMLLAALLLAACNSADRVAGSSTEAGNAGGKLSLSNGDPAADVSVALVARTFVPDTAGVAAGDQAGAYYRTRTGPDGRFLLKDVQPGTYRVMAVGASGGVMAESLTVSTGPDTALVDDTLKALGALRGVAKLVGSDRLATVWVRPVATLKNPPIADSLGGFRLDSLPEGQYELLPQCFGCVPAESTYRVWVKAGKDALVQDTLKVYPDYFLGFPAAGELEVLSRSLPISIAGKPSVAEDDAVRPLAAHWTWDGSPVPGRDDMSAGRVSQTAMVLDEALLGGAVEGRAAVVLVFPDTQVIREWTVRIVTAPESLPMLAVEADSAVLIRGLSREARWRFRVSGTRMLAPEDVAFWGLAHKLGGNGSLPVPGWISLAVSGADSLAVAGRGPEALTFLLIPDSVYGGRVFRARRDERLADFDRIRLLDRGRLGFPDPVVPAMRAEGLFLDRQRGGGVLQRYRVDASGKVSEVLGDLVPPGGGGAMAGRPLLFWRTGGKGFAWDKPARDAAISLAVTREGRAIRLDAAAAAVDLPAAEMAALEDLLGPLSGDPPARPDTAPVPPAGSEYLYYGDRGLLLPAGEADTLLAAFHAWLLRNRLHGSGPAFPLGDAAWRFQGFAIDPAYRNTGDTLILVLTAMDEGAEVRESLSPASATRLSGDTAQAIYRLFQDGDTLVAQAGGSGAVSRLFGNIGGRRALFAVAGLRSVTANFQDGLPVLDGGGNILAGRLEGDLVGWGKVLASPGILLDGRGIESGGTGMGFLYTPADGLERAWRFGGRSKVVTGWNRL